MTTCSVRSAAFASDVGAGAGLLEPLSKCKSKLPSDVLGEIQVRAL